MTNIGKEFTVKYSMADISGITFEDEKAYDTEKGKRVLLTYSGDK